MILKAIKIVKGISGQGPTEAAQYDIICKDSCGIRELKTHRYFYVMLFLVV